MGIFILFISEVSMMKASYGKYVIGVRSYAESVLSNIEGEKGRELCFDRKA